MRSPSFLAVTLLPLAACATAGAGEIHALDLPADADVWWSTVSADGHAAWSERRGSDAFLHAGGRVLGPFP